MIRIPLNLTHMTAWSSSCPTAPNTGDDDRARAGGWASIRGATSRWLRVSSGTRPAATTWPGAGRGLPVPEARAIGSSVALTRTIVVAGTNPRHAGASRPRRDGRRLRRVRRRVGACRWRSRGCSTEHADVVCRQLDAVNAAAQRWVPPDVGSVIVSGPAVIPELRITDQGPSTSQ